MQSSLKPAVPSDTAAACRHTRSSTHAAPRLRCACRLSQAQSPTRVPTTLITAHLPVQTSLPLVTSTPVHRPQASSRCQWSQIPRTPLARHTVVHRSSRLLSGSAAYCSPAHASPQDQMQVPRPPFSLHQTCAQAFGRESSRLQSSRSSASGVLVKVMLQPLLLQQRPACSPSPQSVRQPTSSLAARPGSGPNGRQHAQLQPSHSP